MNKRKLNYRFHNPNPPEVLEKEPLQICIGANMKKVERAIRESVEKESTLRVIAIDGQAQVAKLKERYAQNKLKITRLSRLTHSL